MSHICALLAFALGVFAPNFFPLQPALSDLFYVVLLISAIFLLRKRFPTNPHIRHGHLFIQSLLLGLGIGIWSASEFAGELIPEALNNHKFIIQGSIAGVPEYSGRSWKLEIEPDNAHLVEANALISGQHSSDYLPKKIRVSLYGQEWLNPLAGDHIIAEVKLRRPNGLKNYGLFDYQRWLISRGYSATGYISELVSLQTPEKVSSWRNRLDRWRAQKSQQIQQTDVSKLGLQLALMLGDRRFIEPEEWQLFISTGTVHLMVISGLHIGFISGLAFFLCRWGLSLLSPVTGLNAHLWAKIGAIVAAGIYAALAGFSIPTMRALIMVIAFLLPGFFLRSVNRWFGFSLALVFVALIDPRAVLQTGFWLSFSAVALIFLSFKNSEKLSYFKGLLRLQLVFLIGFSPFILWLQGQYQPASFPANMISVPLISLIVVPLELFGLIISFVSLSTAESLWNVAGWFLQWQVDALHWLNEFSEFEFRRAHTNSFLGSMAVFAGLSLFYWGRWWQKGMALSLMLTMFIRVPEPSFSIEVRVFDVGQGLAILIRQKSEDMSYSLLYDTGPKFSERFDAGADIVAPILRQLQIQALDDLVISHPDMDHFGGFEGLVETIGYKRLWIGRLPEDGNLEGNLCLNGNTWQVNGIHYEFIYPIDADSAENSVSDNDRSCVLQIRFGDQKILIPGDVTSTVEKRLLLEGQLVAHQTLLIMPHHGSKSSSSYEFVDHVKPTYALASAGYLNSFGHPAEEVVGRYVSRGSRILNTAEQGMIRFVWEEVDASPSIQTEAEKRIFWWQK